MQIISSGDNLHEMSNLVFWEKQQKYVYFKMPSAEIFTQHAEHYIDAEIAVKKRRCYEREV